MDESKLEQEQAKWCDDPRNTTYWNARGKVFRAWPLGPHTVQLTDISNGGQVTLSNIQIQMAVEKGDLTEIDFTKPVNLPLGGERVRATTPQKESELRGKYAQPSSLHGKYAKPTTVVTPDMRALPHTAPSTAAAPTASPESRPVLPGGTPERASGTPASALRGKYSRKEL